jgi:hypothetical protein
MKKTLFICLLLFAGKVVSAPGRTELYIITPPEINYYEQLFNAVVVVESRGDVYAFNFKELAAGPVQIRPVRINDYNRRVGTGYTIVDCFDIEFSRKVFIYFAQGKSYETAARNWNGKWNLTEKYWKKVKSQL